MDNPVTFRIYQDNHSKKYPVQARCNISVLCNNLGIFMVEGCSAIVLR